jgi:uncharacterized membrane protein
MTTSVAPVENPGKTLGLIGFILTFIPALQLIGFILSIVGFNRSKKAGLPNGLAKAGIILGIIGIVAVVIIIVIAAVSAGNLAAFCTEHGNGTFDNNGVAVTCGA